MERNGSDHFARFVVSIVSEKSCGVNGAPGGLSALPVNRRRGFEVRERRAGIVMSEITQRSGYAKRKPVRVLFRQLLCRREICFDIGFEEKMEISKLSAGIWIVGRERRNFFRGRKLCGNLAGLLALLLDSTISKSCMLGKLGQLFVGFERGGGGVTPFREIRDEAQFERVARGKRDGVVPMQLSIERRIALLGGTSTKAFHDRGIKRQIGASQKLFYFVPALQNSQGVESRQEKLVIFERPFDRKQREDAFGLLVEIEPSRELDQICYFAATPACDRLVVDPIRIFGMKLDAQVGREQSIRYVRRRKSVERFQDTVSFLTR